MSEYSDRLKGFGISGKGPKVTKVDTRESGGESATLTEHWDGRTDVNVTPQTLSVDMRPKEL